MEIFGKPCTTIWNETEKQNELNKPGLAYVYIDGIWPMTLSRPTYIYLNDITEQLNVAGPCLKAQQGQRFDLSSKPYNL